MTAYLDTIGIKQPEVTVVNNEVTETPAVINNYPFTEFKKLVNHAEIAASRVENGRKLRNNAELVIAEWQQSLQDNQIDDEDSEVFTVAQVNTLLGTLGLSELELTRKFVVNVTVELSFTVEVEAKNEDEARDNVVEDVEMNANWSRAVYSIAGEVGDVYADSVDGEAELA
jgi:hypothetical protein